ncbi:hypothetical protein [Micromonospora sp. NBC_01412]|uniref:hypothetical protein n=1 Tax=Micromonospora sp. NBC_01412 TaxID=2903590 RepID=UPI003251AE69
MVPAPALPAWPPPESTSHRDGPAGRPGGSTPGRPVSGGPAPTADRPTPGLYGSAPTTAWPAAPPPGRPGGRVPAGPPGRPDPATADLASTAYGTEGPGFATVALPTGAALDNSGSLTGHILAQGWADAPTPRSRTTKVVAVLAVSLGLLVAIGVLVVLVANDAMGGLVGGLLNK